MKKLFVESVGMVFMILCVPVYAWGDNVVFNPGFDMSPWDSGWTIETDTSSKWDVTLVIAEVDPDSGKSLPNCCYLRTYSWIDAAGGGGSGAAEAKAMITQNFDGITNCMIKAYVKWDWQLLITCPLKACNNMEGYINNEWKVIWEALTPREKTWTEVCTTLADNDTLSGIRFCTEFSFCCDCICGTKAILSYLWVDDIYVGEVGVEESEELRVKSLELQVYPNPFVKFTTIQYQLPVKSKVSLRIYDVAGRCVKTLIDEEKSIGYYQVKWDGEGLSTGIYFAKFKAGDYKETKKLILMR